MNPLPELTPKQVEAVETLLELHWEARLDSPDARAAFLAVALLLAQRKVLDYLVAALLKQTEALNIPPTKSLLFRDMAFEIENAMREGIKKKAEGLLRRYSPDPYFTGELSCSLTRRKNDG